MSKLYLKTFVDSRKPKTSTAHKRMTAKMCYGSKYDSRCVDVTMVWEKEISPHPQLWVDGKLYKEYKM